MPGEKHLIREALAALRRTAGIEARILPHAHPKEADAAIQIDAARRKHLFLARVKPVDRFGTPAQVKALGKDWQHPPLLIAPYIARETANRCRDLHLPFLDTAGNAYLEGPGFLIYIAGNPRKVNLPRQNYRALTQAGLRIVFTLLCRPDLAQANYRTVAAGAGVALGTVGPVLHDLEKRGLIRLKRDGVRIPDPNRLLQDWVTHYPIVLRPKLTQRRFEADPKRLASVDLRRYNAFWGGEMGADKLTHNLKPAMFTIYANEPVGRLVAANRMRAKEDGNVEVLEIFWHFPPAPGLPPDVAPPALVYADLMATGDGRNLEIARLLDEQYIQPTFGQAGQTA